MTDFIILGTGYEVDLEKVGYLDGLRDDILLWRDVVELDDTPIDRAIGRHPYLGPNLECRGRSVPVFGHRQFLDVVLRRLVMRIGRRQTNVAGGLILRGRKEAKAESD